MYQEEMPIQNIIKEIDTIYGNQDSEQGKKNHTSIYLNGFSQIKFPREFWDLFC